MKLAFLFLGFLVLWMLFGAIKNEYDTRKRYPNSWNDIDKNDGKDKK